MPPADLINNVFDVSQMKTVERKLLDVGYIFLSFIKNIEEI